MGHVGHVDSDAFYTSAERVRFPRLRDRPVAVLGNQGACVIARSYEMRDYGVIVGEPVWEARAKCPEGIFVQRDFRWYESLSRAMCDVMRGRYPKVEFYSIDEFFFEVPECDYRREAEWLRDHIWRTLGVPVTVGIARSRSLAKLISDSAKPFGAKAVLDDAEEEALLEGRAVTEITGIAGRRAKRLELFGIRTCLDFRRADRKLIRELLTCSGEALWWEINGEPVVPIHARRPAHKALSRGGSFGPSTNDPNVLHGWLVRNLERLVRELRYHEVRTGRLTLLVDYRDGRTGAAKATLEAPSARFDTLLETLRPCLRRAWVPHAYASRMHIIAEELVPRNKAQRGLFQPAEEGDPIGDVMQLINDHLGRFKLRSAATLYLPEVYAGKLHEYDVCDIHGKSCF